MTFNYEQTTIVKVLQGTLQGGIARTDNGVEYLEFLDVPYAKPPIGELRFKNPEPPQPWDGVRDATKIDLNHISCQYYKIVRGSEDCLYLNVYVPKLPPKQCTLLPVMVHIHGGGFLDGNGTNKNDLGQDYFIEKNVVVVSMNYRLGLLGFLCLDIPEVPGNMGLKDQILALKWVQNNIESFGGDKNNVTLYGVSAGAAFIDYLLLAPTAQNLFHKAILQSGSSLNHWSFNHNMKDLLKELLLDLNFSESFDDKYAIYKYLRNVPFEILTKKTKKTVKAFNTTRLYFGFVPTVEKDFGDGQAIITKKPYKLFKEGKYHKIPVIKGFCDREGYLTLGCKVNTINILEPKTFFDLWPYKIEDKDIIKHSATFSTMYLETVKTESDDKYAVEFFSDFDVVSGVWLHGNILAKHNVPVYMYEFSYDGNLNFVKLLHKIEREGAAHADDMGYMFKFPCSQQATEEDIEMRNTLTTLWTNFAKTGNPTPNDDLSIQWPKFTPDSQMYLNINTSLTIKSNYEPKRMAVFKKIYDKYKK
ncbi:acetylcholinesterase-like [Zerene cesonia]|uniref:acetylcholinesterase-like n=1 Tax=Zerene cesonia TaxID=33412 RepID=UPI0018E51D26|nr:acetylcholinesterase-like [Zerene cesonia]